MLTKAQIQRRYYEKNREKIREKSRLYRLNNREICIARTRDWQKRHPERCRVAVKKYAKLHPERVAKRTREYRLKNIEKTRERDKKWRKENKHKVYAWVDRRKLRKALCLGDHTAEQWISRVEFYGWRCRYCDNPLDSETLTKDHAIPIARGGTNWPSNLVPSCQRCNCQKKSLTIREYMAWRASRAA